MQYRLPQSRIDLLVSDAQKRAIKFHHDRESNARKAGRIVYKLLLMWVEQGAPAKKILTLADDNNWLNPQLRRHGVGDDHLELAQRICRASLRVRLTGK